MTYDNIKSHKKPGFHPLSRRHILEKPQVMRAKLIPLPPAAYGLDLQTYYVKYQNRIFLKRISNYQKMYI